MIGIYGGSFDPIHLGHLGVAAVAMQTLALQQLIFMPVGIPPHRHSSHASAQVRLRLLQIALTNQPDYLISRYEIEQPTTSWTINTLQHFHIVHGDAPLCLIMGSDAFKQIHRWRHWRELLDHACMLIVHRAGDAADLNTELQQYYLCHKRDIATITTNGNGILWIDAALPDISSTQVRQAIANGDDLYSLLPPAVADTIINEKIYR